MCDTKTDYMWWVSLFPYLHGREGEDSCSIQCSQVSLQAIVISTLKQLQHNAKQLKVKAFL
jgi:hypothetical protein